MQCGNRIVCPSKNYLKANVCIEKLYFIKMIISKSVLLLETPDSN